MKEKASAKTKPVNVKQATISATRPTLAFLKSLWITPSKISERARDPPDCGILLGTIRTRHNAFYAELGIKGIRFAVNTLKSVKKRGRSAQNALPVLAAYMGHSEYKHTIKYLKFLDAYQRLGLVNFVSRQPDQP